MAFKPKTQLPIQHLYAPDLASVFIGSDSLREFKIPRALIDLSDYFRIAFDGKWLQSRHGPLILDDVQEWIFECFVGWLYTAGLSRNEHSAGAQDKQDNPERGEAALPKIEDLGRDQEGRANADKTGDTKDPVDWSYRDIFQLYIFADKYDTRGLRDAALQLVQLKDLAFTDLTIDDYAFAFDHLSSETRLFKYLLEDFTGDAPAFSGWTESDLAKIPASVLTTLAHRSTRKFMAKGCKQCARKKCGNELHIEAEGYHGVPRRHHDHCSYHEHETAEAKQLCRQKWKLLNKEHDLKIDFTKFS